MIKNIKNINENVLHYFKYHYCLGNRALEVLLTGRATQDGLFDHVTARHSLLEALWPLLQEPFTRHHLQLPANATPASLNIHETYQSVGIS